MPIIIRAYQGKQQSTRNKSIIHENMIDIVISGKKRILNVEEQAYLEAGDMMILSKGNNLISEVLPEYGIFSSIVIYFTHEKFGDFLLKYGEVAKKRGKGQTATRPFLIYQQDAFIRNYISSIQLMLKAYSMHTAEFKQLKLEEILLYLLHLDGEKLRSLHPVAIGEEEMLLRRAVEHNVCNPVTVEDLAFLCNTSLSTFKRKFLRAYGSSPQKWLVEQKLKIAADLLKNPSERPGMVFEKVGYENHSSFSHAFKKQFGMTPKEYQEGNMNFHRGR